VIKGNVPLAACVSFAFIIGDTHQKCASPVCQRSGHVSDINLTETCRKVDRLLLSSIEAVPILTDADTSYFFRSEMIVFMCVSHLSFLHSDG
jgi:hypothetical protein